MQPIQVMNCYCKIEGYNPETVFMVLNIDAKNAYVEGIFSTDIIKTEPTSRGGMDTDNYKFIRFDTEEATTITPRIYGARFWYKTPMSVLQNSTLENATIVYNNYMMRISGTMVSLNLFLRNREVYAYNHNIDDFAVGLMEIGGYYKVIERWSDNTTHYMLYLGNSALMFRHGTDGCAIFCNMHEFKPVSIQKIGRLNYAGWRNLKNIYSCVGKYEYRISDTKYLPAITHEMIMYCLDKEGV